MENDPITWTPSTAKVGDLLPKGWKRNPRYSTPRTVDGLKKLLEQFGQYNRVLVDENGIVDGHQRVAAWHKLHGKSFEALTNEASRPLTEKEREDFTLLNHAGGMGFWRFDELADWEPETLVLGGFDQDALDQTRAEMAFLIEMLDTEAAGVPSLDDLEEDYGEHDDESFWPVIRVKVSPETHELWESLMADAPGATEADKAGAIIGAVDAAILGSILS